jgi:hypothetical protein
LPLELRPGVIVPIPCRACGKGIVLFEIQEGTHSVACPLCNVSTQVEVVPEGDRWRLKTSGETETTPALAEVTAAIVSPETTGKIGPLPVPDEEKVMAKQKLTPEKREALRKELKAKIKAGLSRVEILKSLADRYGISTEAMRWYWNAASANGTPKKVAPAAKSKPAKTKSRRPAPKAPTKKAIHKTRVTKVRAAKPSQNGSSLQLPSILAQHTEKEFKRFLAAKKLVPHLEAATRREQELRKSVKSLSRELRAESSKTRKLQRQIRNLTRA